MQKPQPTAILTLICLTLMIATTAEAQRRRPPRDGGGGQTPRTVQESIRSARSNLNLLKRKAESNYQRYEGEYDVLMRSIPRPCGTAATSSSTLCEIRS